MRDSLPNPCDKKFGWRRSRAKREWLRHCGIFATGPEGATSADDGAKPSGVKTDVKGVAILAIHSARDRIPLLSVQFHWHSANAARDRLAGE